MSPAFLLDWQLIRKQHGQQRKWHFITCRNFAYPGTSSVTQWSMCARHGGMNYEMSVISYAIYMNFTSSWQSQWCLSVVPITSKLTAAALPRKHIEPVEYADQEGKWCGEHGEFISSNKCLLSLLPFLSSATFNFSKASLWTKPRCRILLILLLFQHSGIRKCSPASLKAGPSLIASWSEWQLEQLPNPPRNYIWTALNCFPNYIAVTLWLINVKWKPRNPSEVLVCFCLLQLTSTACYETAFSC